MGQDEKETVTVEVDEFVRTANGQAHQDEPLWKHRFECLVAMLKDIELEARSSELFQVSQFPMSESDELWISHDWHITDSEEFAKRNWPPGTFHKWVKAT